MTQMSHAEPWPGARTGLFQHLLKFKMEINPVILSKYLRNVWHMILFKIL
jgi:hypothetical protein